MADIAPAALFRQDSVVNGGSTPSIGSKTLALSASTQGKSGKTTQSTPRVDLEPIYTQLKSSITEYWETYKEAVGRFVTGYLNHDELSRQTDHFLAVDPTREHLHNQLLCGIYANMGRDPPESAVASFVSASDKPAGGVAKPATGDAAEHRLRVEVRQLPPRVRHRIKNIQDEPYHQYAQVSREPTTNKRGSVAADSSQLNGTSSAGGLNKDVEIRKRYTQPLISEVRDLPSSAALTDRLLPICYEEGVASGPADPAECAELLCAAVDTFIKESLASIMTRFQANVPVSDVDGVNEGNPQEISGLGLTLPAGTGENIMTGAFQRRLEREEKMARRGEIKRNELGLLPCEAEAVKLHKLGRGHMGDLRMAWEMGENAGLGSMVPLVAERVVLGDYAGYPGIGVAADGDEEDEDEDVIMRDDHGGINGHAANNIALNRPQINGFSHAEDDDMSIEEADWGWQGATRTDRDRLNGLLDDCLSFGN